MSFVGAYDWHLKFEASDSLCGGSNLSNILACGFRILSRRPAR